MKDSTLLAKYVGGSRLYGLDGPNSDLDERGVFLHEDPLWVYGFKRADHEVKQTAEQDLVSHELTAFLQLATRSNTQTLECLFAPRESFNVLDQDFEDLVRANAMRFVDSEVLYKSLRGYVHGESRLAFGDRTGRLGSKRKVSLDAYGFSPKNVSHLFRLCYSGVHFFETGEYVVSLREANPRMHELCRKVKFEPELFATEALQQLVTDAETALWNAKESSSLKLTPDLELVRKVLKHFYTR